MLIHENDRKDAVDKTGGRICLEFVNTVSDYRLKERDDELTDYASLVDWALAALVLSDDEAGTLLANAGRNRAEADQSFKQAIALRETVYNIFAALADGESPPSTDLIDLSAELAKVQAKLMLTAGDDGVNWDYREGELELDALLWPVVLSATNLLTAREAKKVSLCCGSDCTWLYLDSSKNHSRRWCDMGTCGNREKSRRHYAKQSRGNPATKSGR